MITKRVVTLKAQKDEQKIIMVFFSDFISQTWRVYPIFYVV